MKALLFPNSINILDPIFKEFYPDVYTYYDVNEQGEKYTSDSIVSIVRFQLLPDFVKFEQACKKVGSRYYQGLIINYDMYSHTLDRFLTLTCVCNDKDQLLQYIKDCVFTIYVYDGYIE